MRFTLTLGALLLALSPAVAEDKPAACQFTLEDTWAALEAKGGTIVALVDVPGADIDQVLIYSLGGAVKLGPVAKGCMAAPPLSLFEAKFLKPAVAA